MADKTFNRDFNCKHANVQPKAVFSNAMTMMDKISGWEDVERWVGSKIRGVHVDLTPKGVDKWTKSNS